MHEKPVKSPPKSNRTPVRGHRDRDPMNSHMEKSLASDSVRTAISEKEAAEDFENEAPLEATLESDRYIRLRSLYTDEKYISFGVCF